MDSKDYIVVEEFPIVVDSIEVKLSPSFYLNNNSNGVTEPHLEVTSTIVKDKKEILLQRVLVDCTGKSKEGILYEIKYGVRFALRFDKELDKEMLNNQNFVNFFAEKVYQRISDRINHIGFDMGLLISLPLTRPKIANKIL